MQTVQVLREEAALAFEQVTEALEGVDEPKAWARVEPQPGTYLHTNGSILGIVQHLAVCKVIYGSAAFRSLEIRFRDTHARLEGIGTSWQASLDYLHEAHRYWMASWQELEDGDLIRECMHFSGKMWPAWKILAVVTQHDAYHAGQLALLGSALAPTNQPPDLDLEGEKKYVIDLPTW
ncbi:MAG TPA: DinB family protein [Fimbriimonadaceae bacterium]|nr:DinB family protein [Fimbriimonadaceae bacterium]